MSQCFAADCNHNSYRERCSFFRFPKENIKLKIWIKMCRRADREPNRYSKLCSCHFKDGNKENGPTVFSRNEGKYFHFNSPEKSKRRRKTPLSTSVCLMDSPDKPENEVIVEEHLGAQENFSEKDGMIHNLNSEIRFLNSENECLKSEVDLMKATPVQQPLSSRMSFEAIENDLKFFTYYTGLPNKSVFQILLKWCTTCEFKYYDGWKVVVISDSDQLLLCLMKLRLNLDFTDLSFRFQVSEKTVNNIFFTWLHVIHEVLFETTMNKLPSTAKNRQAMPNSFSQFSNCRVIVDCTEIQCCVPRSSMNAQSQTYSSYKSRNTFKGLVGVSPNGVITFVSQLYPGSCSDKELFIQSGIAEQLVPGDLVLADKGFLIQDCVPAGVSVNIPPFLMHGQFTKEEVKVTKNIAKTRIHVERAIGRMKNYNILLYFPTNLRAFATSIFQVCACLVNLQNPILNLEESNSN